MPKVSVIIPAYNHAKYIRHCIDSVLAQTYQDREIIVVDDGSTDGTLDVLHSYGASIKVIPQKNKGTQAARNTGVQASSGDYIALLDSDDVWLPNKLERQVKLFEKNPSLGLVYSLAYVIDATGKVLSDGIPIGAPISNPRLAFEELLMEDKVPALTAVIRRACLDKVGFFDEAFVGAGDWDLWLRIAANWPVECVPEPLALYRVHHHNTWDTLLKTQRAFDEWLGVLKKMFAELPADWPGVAILRERALARAYVFGARCAVIAGDAVTAGERFAYAVSLDTSLIDDVAAVKGSMVALAHEYSANAISHQRYNQFGKSFFSGLTGTASELRSLRGSVLAAAAMKDIFMLYPQGNFKHIRPLLLFAILNDVSWLRNLGVWSIGIEALLGYRAAMCLRWTGRTLCRMSV